MPASASTRKHLNTRPQRRLARVLAVVVLSAFAASACGQHYPAKVIRILVGGSGGSLDITARLIAQGITGPMGQQVIVDNRASVTTAAEAVAKAPPDGYTLLMAGSNLWLLPLLRGSAPFDPAKDFSPVSLATRSPSLLVVYPSLPVNSVRDLIALAMRRPGEINYASGSAGSASHLAAELFTARAGVKIVRINYKSAALGLIDLIGEQVQMMFPVAGSVVPYLKSGKLRALAVTSLEPFVLAPGIPTMSASGLPGFESVSITGIFAPARLPAAIIGRLNPEIVRALRNDSAKELLLNNGVESLGSSPEELAAFVRTETVTMGRVINDAGIRTE
jgi:tripartite-type tricarboxylate transporter receptor subunit TctC